MCFNFLSNLFSFIFNCEPLALGSPAQDSVCLSHSESVPHTVSLSICSPGLSGKVQAFQECAILHFSAAPLFPIWTIFHVGKTNGKWIIHIYLFNKGAIAHLSPAQPHHTDFCLETNNSFSFLLFCFFFFSFASSSAFSLQLQSLTKQGNHSGEMQITKQNLRTHQEEVLEEEEEPQ